MVGERVLLRQLRDVAQLGRDQGGGGGGRVGGEVGGGAEGCGRAVLFEGGGTVQEGQLGAGVDAMADVAVLRLAHSRVGVAVLQGHGRS